MARGNMQVAEKIREHYSVLRNMAKNGIGTSWFRYLDMYDDYARLCAEGHKQAYVIAYLSEVYTLSRTQIYRIVGKMIDNWQE